ncbi:SCY1 2, partial [Schistosoma japonicum]
TFRLTDMDRKLGIYQLTELLRFLHIGQSLFHNNVSPNSILLTHRNQWRIVSAAFLESICLEKMDVSQYELGPSPWTRKWPKMARPDCHYSAPECLNLTTNTSNPFTGFRGKTSTDLHHFTNKNSPDHITPSMISMKSRSTNPDDMPGPWSDMFSLGLIICALYTISSPAEGSVQWLQNIRKRGVDSHESFLNTETMFTSKDNIIQETSPEFVHAVHLSQSSDIPEAFRLSVCRMPLELVEPVEKLLSRNTHKRPSSQLFALPILYGRIMPILIELHWQFESRQFTRQLNDYTTMSTVNSSIETTLNDDVCINYDSLLIAGLAHLIEVCSSIDYTEFIEKDLISIFEKSSNLKTKICLIHHTRSFLRQVPDSLIEQYILPLMKECLVSNNNTAQIESLNNLELLVGYITLSDLEIIVLQKIMKAFQCNNQQLQLAALHCLVSILTRLSDSTILNDVIPFLLNVSNELKLNKNTSNLNDIHDHTDNTECHECNDAVEQSLSELCNAWKKILYTKSYLLEPQLISKDIFPSLLPHVVDKKVNITAFRILMSTLYALLDLLDVPNSENDEMTDSTTQYRTVPAVTVNAPSIGSGQMSNRSSKGENLENINMGPRKSIARAAVSFVPMLHPNQLKELENSPNIPRRASAHVICPLPPQTTELRFDKPISETHLSDKNNSTTSISFLGLQLPCVSKLRRHSCDAQRQEKLSTTSIQVDKINDNFSRRSSEQSLQDMNGTNWNRLTTKSRGLLNSDEKNLLTAQICEGPFVRGTNIQTKINWNTPSSNEPVKQMTTSTN